MPQAKTTLSRLPFQGLQTKIDAIRNFYVHSLGVPSIRHFAEKASLGPMGKPSLAALFSYLKGHLKYFHDPTGVEYIKSPQVMVSEIESRGWAGGDCDDFASLAYTLLRSLGYSAELRVGWYGGASPSHIYDVVRRNGVMIPFDLTLRKLGDEKPRAVHLVDFA